MLNTKRSKWRKLDNAAQAFPAGTTSQDSRVFRFYCTLKEPVQEVLLQQALDRTVKQYPVFLSVLRKGLFWFYFEKSNQRPLVQEECKEPCSRLYIPDKKSLLFEVTYYQNRINFEVFHALTDGTGATQFIRELVRQYLMLAHPKLPDVALVDAQITAHDQENDGFAKYYAPNLRTVKEKKGKAFQYHAPKMEPGQMQVVQSVVSVKEVLSCSRSLGVSMTVFLTAVYLCAIHEEMNEWQCRRPVVLMIPVNLRNYFPSESMLNFFTWINVSYQFQGKTVDFEDVLKSVQTFFKTELSKERIAMHLSEWKKLEQTPALQGVPLEIKNLGIRAGIFASRNELTSVLSNMSIVSMPEGYADYIERFGVYTSTGKMQLCVCSFQDKLTLGFTSRFQTINIERNFFRILMEHNINVEILDEKKEFPPERSTALEQHSFLKVFTFVCILTGIIGLMVQNIFTPDQHWVWYLIGVVATLWTATGIAYYKRRNLLKNAMWELVVVIVGTCLWDYFTGWRGWALDFVFPIASIASLGFMMIFVKIKKLPVQEYMIYYLMASVVGLIPFLFLTFHWLTVTFPSVICVGICAVELLWLIVFHWKNLRQELIKNFHV